MASILSRLRGTSEHWGIIFGFSSHLPLIPTTTDSLSVFDSLTIDLYNALNGNGYLLLCTLLCIIMYIAYMFGTTH